MLTSDTNSSPLMGERDLVSREPAWRASVLASFLLFFLFSSAPAIGRAESDAVRTARLFMWASDGNVRHRDLVGPAKDSLAQMGEKSAPYLARHLSTTDARERL